MGDFRTDRTRYPTHGAYVKTARDRIQKTASDWGIPKSVVDDLALITSELVTNAVLHVSPASSREIGVTLYLSPSLVRLEVRDSSYETPVVRQATQEEQNGRGLLLVSLLANRWGSREQVVGKTVFAEIDLKPSQLLVTCPHD
ncbi:ATP-binding protein [Streptomyces sp. NPDC005385]|uniref:ATP-binding protein n=1 Tax=Streptomyces sp. NPDC005385 TaxID=3157039 RepID=UPI00339EDD2A